MAKTLVKQYTFTKGAAGVGTVKIPGIVSLNSILLITNVTRNIILYNFADSAFTGTTVTYSRTNTDPFVTTLDNTDGITTITLQVDTTAQNNNDVIQVFIDKQETIVRPWEMGTDAFERTRVANPKSMIDADFEYGLQPTKWQTIDLLRGYPSIYELPGTDTAVTSVTTDASVPTSGIGASLITVNTVGNHGFTVGTPVLVKGYANTILGFSRAEGTFFINTVPTGNSFTYYAKAKVGTTFNEVLSTTYTQVRRGGLYTGATIGVPTITYSNVTSPSTITVTFATAHGLVPGTTLTVTQSSDNGSNNHTLASGPFFVETVPSTTTITYTARAPGAITGVITGAVYTRPDCFYVHRPFDGGVQLGTGGPQHGAQAVRQSKKYVRYQSGKAINYNTGALFAPVYDIRSLTSTGTIVGSTITLSTDDTDHGCQVGAQISISGVTTSGYNGTYIVSAITDERTLTFSATQTLGATTAVIGSPCTMSVLNWHGSTVRAGTFDDQNGMFWQYDGQQMALGRRSSTFQLSGVVSVNSDSNAVTGSNTRFTQQLANGQRIVIRGMTHVVANIINDTSMTITPDYRGAVNAVGVKICKTIDYLIPQTKWNIDRCDGTNGPFNPSGYLLKPDKMQMIGMQWTWYGAGFIDYMLRGPEGKYIFVHRIKNSNVNTEAYMRTGNMPVRYEVLNEAAESELSSAINSSVTTLPINDTTYFPTTGTVYIDNEIIRYTGKSTSTGPGNLTGCTRETNLSLFTAGSLRSFTAAAAASHSINAGVILISQTATPIISHWGSAMMSDGGFDEDRGYIFNYQSTNTQISTRRTSAFAIRLAPTVSNAITGDLGVRELLNRAQLLLQGIEVTAGGSTNLNSALVIEGVLNPQNYPTNPALITWNTLNSANFGGQPSFAQIALGSSVTFNNTFTLSTTTSGAVVGATTIPVANTTGLQIGDDVISTSVLNAFAGNTRITAINAGTSVVISAPLITALTGSANVTFFRNTYAVPGETIFSFIAGQSSRDALDLVNLKELTNTPIGGRGTFPNGPDVLFINLYLTQGAPILGNVILRWGEAQA
jgi:hypothetical protein